MMYTNQETASILRVLAELCYKRVTPNFQSKIDREFAFLREYNLFICYQALIDSNGRIPPQEMPHEQFYNLFSHITFEEALSNIRSLNSEQKKLMEPFIFLILENTGILKIFDSFIFQNLEEKRIVEKILRTLQLTNSPLITNAEYNGDKY